MMKQSIKRTKKSQIGIGSYNTILDKKAYEEDGLDFGKSIIGGSCQCGVENLMTADSIDRMNEEARRMHEDGVRLHEMGVAMNEDGFRMHEDAFNNFINNDLEYNMNFDSNFDMDYDDGLMSMDSYGSGMHNFGDADLSSPMDDFGSLDSFNNFDSMSGFNDFNSFNNF
ncbi:hypothetical protein GOM49_03415 [Clostridium bovifaecis]|uniref:Uncharacterized protein n=1 Tax=Clostridium bovifaecis TaxID=2184719 RepID=A0A6I6EVV5_9CLOT|nr:hypothetical protein GOM49_03415 [Clostridium bovifaecis]